MRFVAKNSDDVPPKLADPATLAQLEQIAAGNTTLIDGKIYKGTYKKAGKTESQVREWLNKYYNTKCAYCEMLCKAEIEHYRPKKGVDEDKNHTGYYWLCYEWSNLVPSCRYCNTEGGKGNKFPIAGVRVSRPPLSNGKLQKDHCSAQAAALINEQPFLLHPEIDKPVLYLAFEPDPQKRGILIKGIDAGNRGIETIRICNLNREYVIISRVQDALYGLLQSIDHCFKDLADGIIEMVNFGKALKTRFAQAEANAKDTKKQHTLLWWYATSTVETFSAIIAPLISINDQREIVVEAFRLYKAGEL